MLTLLTVNLQADSKVKRERSPAPFRRSRPKALARRLRADKTAGQASGRDRLMGVTRSASSLFHRCQRRSGLAVLADVVGEGAGSC